MQGPELDDWAEPDAGAGARWPSGPLDAAQRAFDLLSGPPTPLVFDCRGLGGLPQQVIGVGQLRLLLMRPSLPREVHDEVWARLVLRSRRDGPAWLVAVTGMALPALRFRAGLLTRGWQGDVEDLDAELLLGFLEHLKTIDLHTRNLAARLVDAGVRAVKRSRSHAERVEAVCAGHARSAPPPRPYDHPDLVLARAVAAVIGPEECALIASTRLEDITLERAAAAVGLSVQAAGARRYRAECALAQAIAAGELTWDPPTVRRGRRSEGGRRRVPPRRR